MEKSNNKTWKRVAAGALSLALVAGAMPANVGGLLTGGKGIVAHAEDKSIAIGTVYHVGDRITFEGTKYFTDDNWGDRPQSSEQASNVIRDYSNYNGYYHFYNVLANSNISTISVKPEASKAVTNPVGLVIKSGDGSYSNPYVFGLTYKENITPAFSDNSYTASAGTPINFSLSENSNPGNSNVTYYYRPENSTDWTEFNPANGLSVGSYKVMAKVAECGMYNAGETDEASLTITAANLAATDYTAPTAKNSTFTGGYQPLLNAGTIEASKGTFQYALGKVVTSDINFNDLAVNDILKIGDNGSLSISNINSISISNINSTVPSENTYESNDNNVITISDDDNLYINNNNTAIDFTGEGGAAIKVTGIDREQGIVNAQLVGENTDLEWSGEVPNPTNAGDYWVSWRIKGAEGYNDVAPQTIKATIAKGALVEKHFDETTQGIVGDYVAPTAAKTLKTAATDTEPAEYYDDLYYTGENQDLINAGSVDNGKGTMQYAIGNVHTINENTTINGEDICLGDIFYFPANVNSAEVTISGETPNFDSNYARLYKEGGYVGAQDTDNGGNWGTVNYYNCIYVYTVGTSAGPTYRFNSGYYDPETGALTSSINNTENKRKWSESVPAGNNAGKYNIAWRIAGNDNYNPVGGVIENEIKAKTAPVLLSNLDGAVITKADGTVLAANDTGNYTVTGGKYYLYTDKTVAGADTTSSIAKLVGRNQTLAGTQFANKYEFTIPTLPADNGYIFSHTNNWSGSVPKSNESQLYVADGDVNVTDLSQLAAVLQSTGTFYYGDQPSAANVVINDGFSKIVLVDDVYLSNDQGTKLDLTSGNVAYGNYKLTAKVTIDSDGDGDLETGTLKTCTLYANVVYAARPMSENKYYLVTANPNFDNTKEESETNKKTIETPLEVVEDTDKTGAHLGTYSVIVPDDKFTYNGTAQKPEIVVKNGGNAVVLTETDYTSNVAEKTNAGSYSFELAAPAENGKPTGNYADKVTVKWSIAQATANINVVAKNDIIYDGAVLDKSDFTFTANDAASQQVIAEMTKAEDETAPKTNITVTPATVGVVINYGLGIRNDSVDKYLGYGGNSEYWYHYIDQLDNSAYIKLPGMTYPIPASEAELIQASDSTTTLHRHFAINNDGTLVYKYGDATELTEVALTEGNGWYLQKTENYQYGEAQVTLYEVVQKALPTKTYDLIHAGAQVANITVTNPNFKDITINNVDANINKRKVAITPAETNDRIFGYEDTADSILQNQLKGTLENAEYKDNALTGNTGFLTADVERLNNIPDKDFLATMFLTIGQEKETTNKLKPETGDMFDFDSFINDAGTYEYKIRDAQAIIAQIDTWIEQIGNNEEQLGYITPFKDAITDLTKDYEFGVKDGSVFTLEKAPLTKELFTLDRGAQEELGFELVNGIPTYTFNSGEFFAPKYKAADTTFGNTGTKKLNEWDFITGGYQKVLLPGSYTVEFTATPDGNYKNTANVPWNVLSNNDYSQLVEVEDKEYDGNEIEPSIKYYCREETEPTTGDQSPTIETVLLNEDEIPDSFKTTYTYYEYDETKVNDTVPLNIEVIEQMKKLDEAPKDAGKYVVVASTKSKGYNIKDSFDVFEITPIEISITPSVTKKELGDPDPVITFKNNLDKVRLEGEDNVALNDVTELKISGRYVDVPGDEPKFVEYDGSVASDWIISLNGLEVNSKNYKLKLTKDTFKVIAHILTDDCIKPTKICVTDETGFADPSSCVEVKTVINGEEYTLVEETDFEFVSKAQTQDLGNYSVQIKGIGNFEGYAETTVEVIGNISLAESEDIAKLVKITERKSEPNINPANSKMYVKCGFDVNELAEGIEMVECGIISSSDSKDIPVSELTLENVGKNNIIQRKSSVTNFIDNGKGVSAVGYVIIKDKAGKTRTIYTGNIGGSSVVVTEYEPKQRIKDGKYYVNLGFWVEIDHKDYNVDEYGLLVCNDGTITDVADLTLENAEINSHIDKRVKRPKTNIEDTGKGVIAVGYAKISRADGRTAVIYTNNVGGKYGELPEYQS